jgi:hypothetical protein
MPKINQLNAIYLSSLARKALEIQNKKRKFGLFLNLKSLKNKLEKMQYCRQRIKNILTVILIRIERSKKKEQELADNG